MLVITMAQINFGSAAQHTRMGHERVRVQHRMLFPRCECLFRSIPDQLTSARRTDFFDAVDMFPVVWGDQKIANRLVFHGFDLACARRGLEWGTDRPRNEPHDDL